MTERDDAAAQERLQSAIEAELDDDEGTVVGWVVVYETVAEDGEAFCGHLYGPAGLTSWRALGMLAWTQQHTIGPGDDGGD